LVYREQVLLLHDQVPVQVCVVRQLAGGTVPVVVFVGVRAKPATRDNAALTLTLTLTKAEGSILAWSDAPAAAFYRPPVTHTPSLPGCPDRPRKVLGWPATAWDSR
jgi:hypothetical protein